MKKANKRNVLVAKNKNGKGWYVKSEGASRAAGQFKTQAEAFVRGREIARRSRGELSVCGTNGEIRDKRSYGHDPYPPRG